MRPSRMAMKSMQGETHNIILSQVFFANPSDSIGIIDIGLRASLGGGGGGKRTHK